MIFINLIIDKHHELFLLVRDFSKVKLKISGIKISVLNAEDINNGEKAELFLNSIWDFIVGIYFYLRRGQNFSLWLNSYCRKGQHTIGEP